MQTFLVRHPLHYGHILLTSALWESSSWRPASWQPPLLPWAKALPSWYGQRWAYCQMAPLHFPPQLNYNTRHRFKFRTSRPCKANSKLFLLFFRTLHSPKLTTGFFFRRKSRFCSAWESLEWAGDGLLCWGHTGPLHTILQNQSSFALKNNLSVIEISFLETRGVLCWWTPIVRVNGVGGRKPVEAWTVSLATVN